MIVIVICTISIIGAMGLLAWYLNRAFQVLLDDLNGCANDLQVEVKNVWVLGANIINSIDGMTKQVELLRADFKLLFDEKFAKNVNEIVKLGVAPKDTMTKIGLDGKEYIVPIDKGW